MGKVSYVGEVVLFGGSTKEIAWVKGKLPPVGSKLYTADHSDELATCLRDLIPAVRAYLMSGDVMAQNIKKNTWNPVITRALSALNKVEGQ